MQQASHSTLHHTANLSAAQSSRPLDPISQNRHTLDSRMMSTRRCTAVVKAGKIEIPCPCSKGIFIVKSQSTLEIKCQHCDHLLSGHEDAHPRSSPTAFASNSDYTQGHITKPTINPTRCLRKDTVSKLAALLDSQGVVHVRGTPASGKTVLSELLRDYYLENHRNVFLLPTWKSLESFPGNSWAKFAFVLRLRYPQCSSQEFFASQSVILLDEAQASYPDALFWNTIIKKLRDGDAPNIKICLFCSYGNPLTAVDRVYFTPAHFSPAQRITLTPQPGRNSPKLGLFYTPEEFNEAVLLLTTNMHEEEFTADEEAMRYIYELTNGHPGGVKALVNYLHFKHRHDIKHGCISTITKDHILDDLKDDNRVFTFISSQAVFRSFPTPGQLTRIAAATLGEILEEGSMQFDINNVGMQTCYERGWLHRISFGDFDKFDIAVLPSRLHEKWLEFIIGKQARPLPPEFDQLEKLCLEVFRNFSKTSLRNAVQGKKMSTAAKYRPMEAQYQDEFYRSFNVLAGRGVPICSEWSRTGDGRVDFYIPEKKWAIELLRDHDRVDEHISQFKEGGKYHSWLKDTIDDWIIINCASSPLPKEYLEPRLWTAVFANDYSELKIYDYQKRPLIDICLQN